MTFYELLKSIINKLGLMVRTDAQSLSDMQKSQVRENIGAMSADVTIPSVEGFATEDYVDDKLSEILAQDASGQVNSHNVSTEAHNDIRLLIDGLTTRLNTLADSDDTTLDQMSEVVAYIKSNKSLIDNVTTNKVNVDDIINNLTTSVSNKPLSAAQGVVLKSLIDAIVVPTKVSELANDKGYLTSAPVTSVNGKSGAVNLTALDVSALPDTTDIPSKLSDLTSDTTHRTVTDEEKTVWNAKAETSSIPTKVSQLTNDAGFITGYTETDPTVPAWAKASTKPSYTKSEVGLGNVDNTSDMDKPVSTAQKAAIDESVADKLSFEAQELTAEQKTQSRTNIGAAGVDHTHNIATETTAGFVKVSPATSDMTEKVGINEDGQLVTKPISNNILDYLLMKDVENGLTYVIEMRGGNLVSSEFRIPCTSIKLVDNWEGFSGEEYNKVLTRSDEVTLTPIITPENTTDKVVWSSSDETIVTVVDGVMTCALGQEYRDQVKTATIYARCGECVAEYNVRVAYSYWPITPV